MVCSYVRAIHVDFLSCADGCEEGPTRNHQAKEGSNVVLLWRYCQKHQDSITGIIISRGARNRTYLLGMNSTGNIFYYGGIRKNYGITWEKESGSINFVKKKVSKSDAGRYVMEIRRVGYEDLEHKVNLIVLTRRVTGAMFIFLHIKYEVELIGRILRQKFVLSTEVMPKLLRRN